MSTKRGAAGRSRNDVSDLFIVLRRFDPKGARAMLGIGALSFLSGITEAGVLAVITSVAVATSQPNHVTSFAGLDLSQHERLIVAVGLLACNSLAGYLLARVSSTVAARAALEARQQLLEAFHHASFERKSGDRLGRLQEALTTYVDKFASGFNSLIIVVTAALSLASFGVAAIIINVEASVALVLVGLLVFGVQRPANRRTKQASRRLRRQRAVYAEGATESVALARELAVFGVSGEASANLRELDRQVSVEFRKTRFISSLTPRLYQTTAFLLTIGALAVISSSKTSSLGSVAAVALIVLRSLSYGQQLLTNMQSVAENRPYLDNLTAMIDSYRAEPRRHGATKVGSLEMISFDGVCFAYQGGDRNVVTDLSLAIHSGETIGVIGPSGAGKTTLVNLLLRLYEPSGGQINVNGVPLSEVDDLEWHRRTAIVPQEPRLIHGTIADNIRLLRMIPDEAVEQAAEEANVATFVRTLPDGFDSPVGALGQALSGGQRQRICIARALAGRPDLLVLDEPTSALDGESEAAIQRTLHGLKGRVTMVVVAHRLSTLATCDRIVVVDGGRITAMGSPAELRRDSSYYREALEHAGL